MPASDLIARERGRLPMFWRALGVGRSLDDVPGLLEPGEELLALCAGNASDQRNYLLVATDRRLIVLPLGTFGGAKDASSIGYAEIESFESDTAKGRLHLEGAGTTMTFTKAIRDQVVDLDRVVAGRRSAG